MNKELKFELDDIYQSDFIYTTLIKKDGTKMYQIHKCYATGKTGIVSENDFEKLLSIYYPKLSTNDSLVIDNIINEDICFFRTDIKIEEAIIRQDIKLEYPKDYFKTDIKIKES